ncbi:MAG: hypothetical protein E6H76_09745 [Betaproteobacteria bacterium]|nr:MAG: hypothetical protein E6H76_09745 [Betaproteobacteria bacterium]TMI02363.1 MAG: hypothetical protein E6H46_10870 [Betaproteobacteria bacterium]
MNKWLRGLLGGALSLGFCLFAPYASANFHLYQINQIYTNGDGSIQFVLLHESLGYNGENFLGGHTFTSTQGGTTQTYTFNKDLPGGSMGGYGGMPSPTAYSYVLIATQGFAALGLVTPDYVIPNGFLPLANGTINYAGVDQVTYTSLPTDGTSAIDRSAMVVQNVAINFAGDSASVTAAPPPSQTATAVEYYYDVWNFYFETSFPDEIAALDGGAFGGAWKRTGETFKVWPSASNPAAVPTCRFFSTAFTPKSSHFYTPFASECLFRQTDPASSAAWQLETAAAFYLELTDASGNCPAGTAPLYRVFNNGMNGAPNHRFTPNRVTRDHMVMLGWLQEGNGPDVIFACVPQ